jgi:tetratricopeptide (TPR) repeat protein
MSAQNYDATIAAGIESLKHDTITSSIFWYIGVAHQLNKNYKSAKTALEKGRGLTYDPDIKFQFNSQLGDVYNELELYTESDAAFDAALLYDPNNDHCLNNYSYFLSLRGVKLMEAEAMCKRLMRLRPNLPNYMDTYAWVLYKLEKYEDAKNLFEQALKTSSDATIWEHYGRTLIELNQKKEAIEAFKLAIKNGSDKNEIQPLINSLNE